jgi:hypothetical protein
MKSGIKTAICVAFVKNAFRYYYSFQGLCKGAKAKVVLSLFTPALIMTVLVKLLRREPLDVQLPQSLVYFFYYSLFFVQLGDLSKPILCVAIAKPLLALRFLLHNLGLKFPALSYQSYQNKSLHYLACQSIGILWKNSPSL